MSNRTVAKLLRDIDDAIESADRLSSCLAEFPDDPGCCGEHIQALDDALARLPWTRAHAIRSADDPPAATEGT